MSDLRTDGERLRALSLLMETDAELLVDFYVWLQMRRGHAAPTQNDALAVVEEYADALPGGVL